MTVPEIILDEAEFTLVVRGRIADARAAEIRQAFEAGLDDLATRLEQQFAELRIARNPEVLPH